MPRPRRGKLYKGPSGDENSLAYALKTGLFHGPDGEERRRSLLRRYEEVKADRERSNSRRREEARRKRADG